MKLYGAAASYFLWYLILGILDIFSLSLHRNNKTPFFLQQADKLKLQEVLTKIAPASKIAHFK